MGADIRYTYTLYQTARVPEFNPTIIVQASASWQQNTRYTPAARQPITIAPAHEFGSESGGQSAPLPITATKATAGISATLSGSAPGGGGRLAGPPPARPRKLTPEGARFSCRILDKYV
jgi:hypothetical protein